VEGLVIKRWDFSHHLSGKRGANQALTQTAFDAATSISSSAITLKRTVGGTIALRSSGERAAFGPASIRLELIRFASLTLRDAIFSD